MRLHLVLLLVARHGPGPSSTAERRPPVMLLLLLLRAAEERGLGLGLVQHLEMLLRLLEGRRGRPLRLGLVRARAATCTCCH
jgi:hypothetical protein